MGSGWLFIKAKVSNAIDHHFYENIDKVRLTNKKIWKLIVIEIKTSTQVIPYLLVQSKIKSINNRLVLLSLCIFTDDIALSCHIDNANHIAAHPYTFR